MSNDISRRISGSAIAALCLLISGAGLLILLFLFEPFLRDHHVINLEFGAWLGMGLIALAAIFGATSRRSTLGKTVCCFSAARRGVTPSIRFSRRWLRRVSGGEFVHPLALLG